jgi:hypothetical protein
VEITPASRSKVRWYVRYHLSYTEVSEWLAERARPGRSEHHLPLGAASDAAAFEDFEALK